MAQYDLKVIQGTENLIIKTLPQELSYTVEQHKNVTIIKFNSTKDISEYANIITGLSITDQKTSVKLDYREWRVNKVAAGINPSLACVLCQIAEIHDTDSVLDPFCGASVIPISALLYYKARVAIASDISNYAFNSSRKNSEILNLLLDLSMGFLFL
jgi:23S rRNA G2445 N2-methylase RlmL